MRLLWLIFLSILAAAPVQAAGREILIVSGGPALRFFEESKAASHDHYWGNFIGSAVFRLKELKAAAQPGDQITWMVYRPGYKRRGKEQNEDLMAQITAKAQLVGINLIWFDHAREVEEYVSHGNNRAATPLAGFEYFGHSNKACFMFDYSNDIDGMSIEYLHAKELKSMAGNVFVHGAYCKSWGCHSGEYYSDKWKRQFGVPMVGAIGKTDYSAGDLPVLSDKNGRWAQ